MMSGSKSRSGEGSTADCVSGMSEMCIADPELTTIHTNPERRGRRCENSARSGSCDRWSGMILRTRAHSPLTKKQDYSRPNKQLWRCGRGAKHRKTFHRQKKNRTKTWRDHTVETNTTRDAVKRNSRHTTRDEEVMNSMRAAKPLDPSIHFGDTQAWLNVQTEEDVVMKTDMRSRKESRTCVRIHTDTRSRDDRDSQKQKNKRDTYRGGPKGD